MPDTRVRVPLDGKVIVLIQLDRETGGHGLCESSTEVVAVEGSPVTAQELEAAVAAHVPGHVPLDPFGRLLTELAVHEVIPVAEAANLRPDLTVERLQNEFLAWLEAAGL